MEDEHGNRRKPPLTSLEILQKVLHGEKYKSEFEAVAVYMKQIRENNNNEMTSFPVPSCLAPNTKATRKLANKVVEERNTNFNKGDRTLPLPILNVGFPKVGSTNLKESVRCIVIKASHRQEGKTSLHRLDTG